MISLYSSLNPIRKYSTNESFIPLIVSSQSFVVIYDEYPRRFLRVFNLNACQIMSISLPSLLVDMCYSMELDLFILLAEKSIYQFNPSIGIVQRMDEYVLLKDNRSMSSICAINDGHLLILYRFGEYLDVFPKGKRIWKRRHLCDSINEDISQIRSSKNEPCLIGLMIVEWNGIWRVDIFSSSLHKLHQGFRFTGWTIHTRLSDWSPFQCWFIGHVHQVMIDSKGQPRNISPEDINRDVINITWIPSEKSNKLIVTQGKTLLTFFK